ncbi:MAG: molybdenum cofactor guanylyltransferase MobA [Gammaproteobacteria bacterium]
MDTTNACKQSISITGVILAGGLARRMGGGDKALLSLSGTLLIRHILDILEPQVDQVVINANRNHDQYKALGQTVLSDTIEGYVGPLAGMATAMKYVSSSHILVVPCDSPFLDENLVARFIKAYESSKADICVAHDGERLQPVFALIKTSTRASLEKYLADEQRKIDTWYSQQSMAKVDFSDLPEMFININTPEDLEKAESHMIMNKLDLPIIGFAAHSGTGKTTLLKKLIANLKEKQLRIGLVKHAHHGFEVDIPGKDSYELRKAGASQVIVGSQKRWAHMVETPENTANPTLASLINHFDHKTLDLILIEGFKLETIPKIEVFRPSLGKERLSKTKTGFIAIACDEPLEDDVQLPILDLNNTEQIASFVLELVKSGSNKPESNN